MILIRLPSFRSTEIDLFILAVAIGYRQKKRTPLKNSHGIIRAEYILDNSDALAIIQQYI